MSAMPNRVNLGPLDIMVDRPRQDPQILQLLARKREPLPHHWSPRLHLRIRREDHSDSLTLSPIRSIASGSKSLSSYLAVMSAKSLKGNLLSECMKGQR